MKFLSDKGKIMINQEVNEPLSVLSLIEIGKLAESYRRKSHGGTERHQDRKNPSVFYSYKPAWRTWKEEDSKFLIKVTVSIFLDMEFTETNFLWFNVLATTNGIKARSLEYPRLHFKLSSSRFLDAEYEKNSKNHLLMPIRPISKNQLELSFS
jgi:hypothetical protein